MTKGDTLPKARNEKCSSIIFKSVSEGREFELYLAHRAGTKTLKKNLKNGKFVL